MIKIKPTDNRTLVSDTCDMIFRQEVEIIADAESDISALEEIVDDGDVKVIPLPGSMAYTADMSVVYQLSPSNVWTKVV